MELSKWRVWIKQNWDKYKYVLIILLLGVIFMLQPQDEPVEYVESQMEATDGEKELEKQLEDILMNIYGAGEVKVLLTVEKGECVTYQTDITDSQSEEDTNHRSQTVLIRDDTHKETGLIHQKISPIYRGAIVLAQGANDPKIKLSIVEAVSKVTGLGASNISVLTMK